MSYQTTVVNTSGAERFFPYLPPNGRTLMAGESFVINGILDTMIALAKRAALMDEYLADQNLGFITATYPSGGTPVTPSGLRFVDDDYDLVLTDTNWLFSNRDATGAIILTLPPPPLEGTFQEVGFYIANAFGMTVKASPGSAIRYGDVVGPDGSEMVSTAIGAQLWVRVASSTLWLVDRTTGGEDGSWSDPS